MHEAAMIYNFVVIISMQKNLTLYHMSTYVYAFANIVAKEVIA